MQQESRRAVGLDKGNYGFLGKNHQKVIEKEYNITDMSLIYP